MNKKFPRLCPLLAAFTGFLLASSFANTGLIIVGVVGRPRNDDGGQLLLLFTRWTTGRHRSRRGLG